MILRVLRLLSIVLLVSCGALPAQASDAALERGTAIIDPLALRELDQGRFGLTHIMAPTRSADTPLLNSPLFALLSVPRVRGAVEGELAGLVGSHKAEFPDATIGVGDPFDFQLFDRAL